MEVNEELLENPKLLLESVSTMNFVDYVTGGRDKGLEVQINSALELILIYTISYLC